MTDIAREKLTATDEQIEAAFDDLGYSLVMSDLCFGPADEIDAFRQARKSWALPGYVATDDPDCLEIQDARAIKGQTKRNVVLIRFGEYCAIYGANR